MIKLKNIAILLLLVCFTQATFAQKFSASVSKSRVAVGEEFQLTYSINQGASSFRPPSLTDFDVYSGPNQSTSMQYVNGNVSQSISYSYILAAKKEGKFTIGPAYINAGGQKAESNTITIEVVKGGAGSNAGGGQRGGGNQAQTIADDNLFTKTIVSKTKAYLGEQITITHKVYTRVNLVGFQDVDVPSYNGFWAQDMPQQRNYTVVNENIDGIAYTVVEFKKTFLFAQRTGTLEIDPLAITCVVRQRSNKRPQSMFDQFFGNAGVEDVAYKIKSKPVKIEIMPLPEDGKPAGFSGAVGNYTFKSQLSKNKVKANEGINLNVSITGKGNLKLIDAPKYNIPQDIESYDPKINDNIAVNGNGVSGSKSFEYLLIPRHAGEYKINQLNFSFFDPEKKQYVSLPSPEFNITVEKGDGNNDNANTVMLPPSANQSDVKMIGSDIRFIKTDNIQLIDRGNYFFGSTLFYTLLIAPALLFLTFIFIRNKTIKENSNTALVKQRKATRVALKRLEIVKQHLSANNKELFYEETLKALLGYLSDKLTMQVNDLSKDGIRQKLTQLNVSEITIKNLSDTIDACEMARYAPSMLPTDLKMIYDQTVTLVTNLENEIKNA